MKYTNEVILCIVVLIIMVDFYNIVIILKADFYTNTQMQSYPNLQNI